MVQARRDLLKEVAVVYKGGRCLVCDYSRYPVGFDFHHLNPKAKSFHIGQGNTRSWARTIKELDKCVILCAICHRAHHAGLLNLDLHLGKNPTPDEGMRRLAAAGLHAPGRVQVKLCQDCSTPVTRKATRCPRCAKLRQPTKITWPPREELLLRVAAARSMEALARELGVSSNAIRKRLRR